MLARIAMIAMITNSSSRVNPSLFALLRVRIAIGFVFASAIPDCEFATGTEYCAFESVCQSPFRGIAILTRTPHTCRFTFAVPEHNVPSAMRCTLTVAAAIFIGTCHVYAAELNWQALASGRSAALSPAGVAKGGFT